MGWRGAELPPSAPPTPNTRWRPQNPDLEERLTYRLGTAEEVAAEGDLFDAGALRCAAGPLGGSALCACMSSTAEVSRGNKQFPASGALEAHGWGHALCPVPLCFERHRALLLPLRPHLLLLQSLPAR